MFRTKYAKYNDSNLTIEIFDIINTIFLII